MKGAIVSLLVALALTGCGTATEAPNPPSPPTSKTAKIPTDYDASTEMATATNVGDRLEAAGSSCQAEPRMLNRYKENLFGNVVSLTCTSGEETVEIAVFRDAAEAEAGLRKFSRMHCVYNQVPTFYVADEAWVVTATTGGDGAPTKEGAAPIAEALGRPVDVLECA